MENTKIQLQNTIR